MATGNQSGGNMSVESVANEQRAIQSRQDQRDGQGQPPNSKEAVQTGQQQPAPPLPKQHLAKPGFESEMELRPRFMAEGYKGSGKLEGQAAIVTGGDSGSGRAVAVL